MYEKHFHLRFKPFTVTPDPRFLFSTAAHREAMAALRYGIEEFRGFILLVGEAGTGKSTLLRVLLDQLDVSTKSVLITHTTVNRDELLQMILHELHLAETAKTRVESLRLLNDFVIGEFRADRSPPVLIIDEAHNLTVDVLEEVRLLTNLEISERKLLQVVLAGQPELESKLEAPELRQLRQRIAVRARLHPLTLDETAQCIEHRLRVAGSLNPRLFTAGAIRAVWEAAAGIPRVIATLCEQSLVNAYGAGKRRVDEAIVLEAVRDTGYGAARPVRVAAGTIARTGPRDLLRGLLSAARSRLPRPKPRRVVPSTKPEAVPASDARRSAFGVGALAGIAASVRGTKWWLALPGFAALVLSVGIAWLLTGAEGPRSEPLAAHAYAPKPILLSALPSGLAQTVSSEGPPAVVSEPTPPPVPATPASAGFGEPAPGGAEPSSGPEDVGGSIASALRDRSPASSGKTVAPESAEQPSDLENVGGAIASDLRDTASGSFAKTGGLRDEGPLDRQGADETAAPQSTVEPEGVPEQAGIGMAPQEDAAGQAVGPPFPSLILGFEGLRTLASREKTHAVDESEIAPVEADITDAAAEESPPPALPVPSSVVYEPPELIERVEPNYPTSLRRFGIEGEVRVRLLVNERGDIVRAEAEPGNAHPALAAAALRAARLWKYRPAYEDGRPVEAWTTARFRFVREP